MEWDSKVDECNRDFSSTTEAFYTSLFSLDKLKKRLVRRRPLARQVQVGDE